jgi:hypothetical protein
LNCFWNRRNGCARRGKLLFIRVAVEEPEREKTAEPAEIEEESREWLPLMELFQEVEEEESGNEPPPSGTAPAEPPSSLKRVSFFERLIRRFKK